MLYLVLTSGFWGPLARLSNKTKRERPIDACLPSAQRVQFSRPNTGNHLVFFFFFLKVGQANWFATTCRNTRSYMEEDMPALGHFGRSLSSLFTQCASPGRIIVLSIDDITNGDSEFLLDTNKKGKTSLKNQPQTRKTHISFAPFFLPSPGSWIM